MKNKIALLFLTIILISSAYGQDTSLLSSFQRNFARGSLSTKIKVLQDASLVEGVEMGPLYLQAAEFIYDNFQSFQNDPVAQELSLLAIRMIGVAGYEPGAGALWRLFDVEKNSTVRMEVANALSVVGRNKPEIINNLNLWLASQNNIYKSGSGVDLQVLREVIVALGRLGDPSSFPLLLSSAVLGYSAEITRKAQEALTLLKGDYSSMVEEVIRKGSVSEKLAALRLMYASERLKAEQKGELASAALAVALGLASQEIAERDLIRQLRYEAVRALTVLKWSKATSLVIEHFNRIVVEWDRGQVSKSFVLEAISCLGSMGTHEAAVRLTLYLELINSYVDNGQAYDEQVVIAVIKNLELLGDLVAFDYLLYTGYLNYSERVKQAAREALKNL